MGNNYFRVKRVSFSGLSKRLALLAIAFGIGSFIQGNVLYHCSLQGTNTYDVDWIHKNLGRLSRDLIIAALLFYIGTLCFLFSSICRKIVKVALVFVCTSLTVLHLLMDTGANIDHHGQYNILALAAIEIVLGLSTVYFILTVKIFRAKPVAIVVYHVSSVMLVAAILYTRGTHYSKDWTIGMYGHRMDNNGSDMCRFDEGLIPWPSLLPKGWTSYLVGPQVCPDVKDFAHLADDYTLTIECEGEHGDGDDDENNNKKASYTIYPNYMQGLKKTNEYKPELDRAWDFVTKSEQTFDYTGPVKVYAEYLEAHCGKKNQFLMQNVKDEAVHQRAAKWAHDTNNTSPPISVMHFMIDALSRAHFYRSLPKSVEVLEEMGETSSTVFEFFRHHALAAHTGPNIEAMYSGVSSEFTGSDTEAPARTSTGDFNYADHPLYWSMFNRDAYAKAWVYGVCEDLFEKYIADSPPLNFTDHEMMAGMCHPDAYPTVHPYGNFDGPYSFRRRCIGRKMVHEHIFDYLRQFWRNYADVGKVATTTLMDAHEGSMDIIKFMDDNFARFLEDMRPHMNNTLLIVSADHGCHMGPLYMWTANGRLEAALPVLFVIMPDWFAEKYPDIKRNLSANQNRLTSHYDTYWMLRTLATLPEFAGQELLNNDVLKKGLVGNIGHARTCDDAQVPDSFCKCAK